MIEQTNQQCINVLKPNEGASKQNSPEKKYKNIEMIGRVDRNELPKYFSMCKAGLNYTFFQEFKMPNKKAKERKQKRRELNDYLMRNGRTPSQIKRIKRRRLGKV